MSNERRYPVFDRIVAECAGGVTVHDAAKEAYRLAGEIGLPVFVKHNGRIFKISLNYEEETSRP